MSDATERLSALLKMSAGKGFRAQFAKKHEGMLSNAAEWARNFTGECRTSCMHTEEEHRDARWHLACVYLDLLEDYAKLRAAAVEVLAETGAAK